MSKERSPLTEYIHWLEENGVNTNKLHWVPEGKKRISSSLTRMMKEEKVLISGYKLKKICSAPHCLNPLHYRIVPNLKGFPNAQEVEELAELVDVEVCENIGFEAYLALFNEDNPLPAEREDMRAAVSLALSRAKKHIPFDDVFWKEGKR